MSRWYAPPRIKFLHRPVGLCLPFTRAPQGAVLHHAMSRLASLQRIRMNDSLTINCPHCGESFPLVFDVTEGSAQFTIDCEVCCRPMQVTVGVSEEGEIESLDIVEE